ncbi:hypothetical protein [Microcoleus asticus]|uniref:Uncharacterized protein n=1 Tax=Microcoleus asticus IPMA8 TaxID=2563858 RepID=A0ABX2D704_9CYAN|nr:hypothetical protein [Microcoleus asticus]NQE38442.1 hypothetical protein [Microcoleus asticus IPMA8]
MTATKPIGSQRRIDRLKAIALERGFTNENAKPFGKLSKTSTWEALLNSYGVEFPDNNAPANWTNRGGWQPPPTNFLNWVDFPQLAAITLASAGVFVLARPLLQHISPSKLFPIPPVQIHIQIGAKS